MKNDWLKKYGGSVIAIMIFAVLLFILFACIYFNLPCKEFWGSVGVNMATTIFALIAGIPIALWIDRRIKSREENQKYLNEREREKEILNLVHDELDYSYNSIFLREMKGNAQSLGMEPLKSDLWEALISSQETKYIEAPKILSSITSAYHILKTVKNMQAQAYIAFRTSANIHTLKDGTQCSSAQLILKDARLLDVLFESYMEEALIRIDERLAKLN